MAKEFSNSFYKTKAWQDCRNGYVKSKRGLCERCAERGLIVPGEIVHHIIELTPDNINNPAVTMGFDNLQLLCRECHAEVHNKNKNDRRYKINSDGSIIVKA